MDPRAVALALGAAVIHAGWNLRLHSGPDRTAAMAVAMLTGGVILSPWLVIAFPAHVAGLVLLSGVAETGYALSLTAAYRRGALSVAYPIGRGVAPAPVTVAAIGLLGQRPSAVVWLGAALLLGGLLLVASGGGRDHAAAIGFACLTGIFIATYSVIDASAVRSAAPFGYLSAVMLVSGALLLLWIRLDVVRLRAAGRAGALIGLESVAAYGLVLLAFQLAPAGRVATVRESSVLIGVLAAREGGPKRLIIGAALVVAGVICASS